MNKLFYIFRHGQTDYNIEKRVQSFLDIPLNAQGIAQATELAKKLADIQFDCIYSSPLSRSLQTAEIVVNNRPIKIITNPGLRERNFGVLCGKIMNITDGPADAVIDLSKEKVDIPAAILFSDDYTPENGESDKMFIKRTCDTMVEIAKSTNANTIGISTHGGVIGTLVRAFTNFDFCGVPNAEYLKMQWDGKNFNLPEQPSWLTKMKTNQMPL